MSNSREKSDGLRREFEDHPLNRGYQFSRDRNSGEYRNIDLEVSWKFAQWGHGAGRRDALEEAEKAICYHCRMGIPVDPPSGSLVFWHRDPNSGRLDICQVAAIRALKEKGPE